MIKDFDLIRFFHENTEREIYHIGENPDINIKPASFKEYPDLFRVLLPKDFDLKLSLKKAILRRKSCRNFKHKTLSLEKLSTLLWLGNGISETYLYEDFQLARRPYPSAGALYPCEVYPLVFNVKGIDNGIYHYCPVDHSLELLKKGDFSNQIPQFFMGQSYVEGANVCLVFSSILERTIWKYGARGYRYILLEIGHLSQNFCLVASAQSLSTLPLGGFYGNRLATYIGIDPEKEPIQYALAIGYKRE